jgi:hypothetical protein
MKKIFISFIGFVSLISFAAETSKIYFEVPYKEIGAGSEFSVQLLVDSVEVINALDLEIIYPKDRLEFLAANNNGSIIDFWKSYPPPTNQEIIKIQGGSLTSFAGQRGKIIELIFQARSAGLAEISFLKNDLFKDDGQGTKVKTNSIPLTLNISADAPIMNQPPIIDQKPPIISEIEIIEDPISRLPLVIFQARDQESGLRSIALRERKWFVWKDWQMAVSPYPLTNGIWSLQIKAQDNKGNISQETIYFYSEIFRKALSAIILAVIGFAFVKYTIMKL